MRHRGIPPKFVKLTRDNISPISCLFFTSTGFFGNEQWSLSRLFAVPDHLHNGCQLSHKRAGRLGQDVFNGHHQLNSNLDYCIWYIPSFSDTATYANQNQQSGINGRETGTRIEANLEYLLDFQGNRAVYLHFYCKPHVPVWLRDLESDTGHLQSFFKRS